jgi:hypothetical protein
LYEIQVYGQIIPVDLLKTRENGGKGFWIFYGIDYEIIPYKPENVGKPIAKILT